jgi:hypothetical protein
MTDIQTSDRDVNRAIRSWLHEDRHEDASRLAGAVLDQVEATPRRQATWWPARRTEPMNKMVTIGLGTAAAVLVLVIGIQIFSSPGGGTGGQQVATATPEPTEPPSPVLTPRAAGDEDLPPGTYFAHPLAAANDSLTVTFTVPEGWTFLAGNTLVPSGDPGTGAPGGVAIQFDDVTALNGDPCGWSGPADDISVGPAVDDLVDALVAQTAYEVSDPVDVTIGGYSGKRIDIVHPTEPFTGETADTPGCDDGNYRIWSTIAHGPDGIYAQGPANRWQANVLDVDGTRLVIVVQDFPGTSADDRAAMDAIIGSLVIEP